MIEPGWVTRVVESIVVASLAAALAVFVNDKIQDHDIDEIRMALTRLEMKVDKMANDVYEPRWQHNTIPHKQ
jgi:hypothetical protein